MVVDLVRIETTGWEGVPPERQKNVETMLSNMEDVYGDPREGALEMIGYALGKSRAATAASE